MKIIYNGHLDDDSSRYKTLFDLIKKFHLSLSTSELLIEMNRALQILYPSFQQTFYLVDENLNYDELPHCFLKYDKEKVKAVVETTFSTGNHQVDNDMLYVPLKGKQGIYGVVALQIPQKQITEETIAFLILVINTAGNAFENAKLYTHSQQLIQDLHFINDTTHRLNSKLRLSETVQIMTEQIQRFFHSEQVGFLLFHKKDEIEVLKGSTPYFESEESQLLINDISVMIRQKQEAIIINAYDKKQTQSNYRSLLAVPMVRDHKIIGIALVLHSEENFFTYEQFRLLQSLIVHSTLAFTNSMLHEELETLVITDHLTHLYSRLYLDERITESMQQDLFGVFILLDIDDFKAVNDTYGHQVGDEVIIQVASILLRDRRSGDIAARWGGEELALYLPSVTVAEGVTIATQLLEKIKHETKPAVTVSGGITYWHQARNDSVTKLFKRADQALYEAKSSGKNKIVHKE